MESVLLKNDSGQSKYKQTAAAIEDTPIKGMLKKEDKLPSFNAIKNEHFLARVSF